MLLFLFLLHSRLILTIYPRRESVNGAMTSKVVSPFIASVRFHVYTRRGVSLLIIYVTKFAHVSHRVYRRSAALVAQLSICVPGRPLPREMPDSFSKDTQL